MSRRFELVAVEQKGYPVARIHDAKANRDHLVFFKAGRFRHWDGLRDDPVTVPGLRRVAKEALA